MKIGRNEACPCGSGKKYKRCCAGKLSKPTAKDEAQPKITLGGAIEDFQSYAKNRQEELRQLGVFLLYSDKNGDAWVLEVTDSDCIQVASEGQTVEVPLEENDETIVMDWSHSFSFKNKQLLIRGHRNKETAILENAPSQKLFAAARKIMKRISPEFIQEVHVEG